MLLGDGMLSVVFLTAYSLLASLFKIKFLLRVQRVFVCLDLKGVSGVHADGEVYLA
jgi:hypothetical protein